MSHFIATALLSLCLLSACNNDRVERLSKRGFYEADKDIAAYALTEIETEVLQPTELLDEDLFSVVEFKSTITLEGANEEKVTLSIIGTNLSDSSFNVTISSAAGLTPQSKTEDPVSFDVPVTNKNSNLVSARVTIEFGDNNDPEQESFLTIKADAVTPVESDSENEETETPPESFTSFYSSETDEVTVYEFKELKEGSIPTYYLHHQNLEKTENILKISTRLSLRKIQ